MAFDTIELTIERRVAFLTLARPEAKNTIDLRLARELDEAMTGLASDVGIGAVVLAGAGETFCLGGDLRSFAASEDLSEYLRDVTHHLHSALETMSHMAPPVVAAVRGFAAGAGLGLACAADIVLVSDNAKFLSAYTNVGLTPDGSTSWALPRLVGLRRALELVLSNRTLDAHEAVDWGIATRVVADADLDTEAFAIASKLADGATVALGGAKRLIRSSFAHSLEDQLEMETDVLAASAQTNQAREGIVAFMEKRAPRYQEGP